MPNLLPDFVVLGTQKGGTTTLHHLLARHPQIFLPASKEVHYFSLYYDRGVAWYQQKFSEADLGQRLGDVTPYYLFHPQAPCRLHQVLPNARFVALLRNPVERALSQYFHACRHGFESLSLVDAIAAEAERLDGAEELLIAPGSQHYSHQKHSYLARSRYERQLQRYFSLFPREQLLLIRSEDLFCQSQSVWETLLNFLGLDGMPLAEGSLPFANQGEGEAQCVSAEIRQHLRQVLEPTYSAMAATYGICWD